MFFRLIFIQPSFLIQLKWRIQPLQEVKCDPEWEERQGEVSARLKRARPLLQDREKVRLRSNKLDRSYFRLKPFSLAKGFVADTRFCSAKRILMINCCLKSCKLRKKSAKSVTYCLMFLNQFLRLNMDKGVHLLLRDLFDINFKFQKIINSL